MLNTVNCVRASVAPDGVFNQLAMARPIREVTRANRVEYINTCLLPLKCFKANTPGKISRVVTSTVPASLMAVTIRVVIIINSR